MRLLATAEPITDGDDVIRDAVEQADVVPLLVAVAQVTGDHSILEPDLRPDPGRLIEPDAGLGFSQVKRARQLAFDALVAYRDGGCVEAPPPTPDQLRRLVEFMAGEEHTPDYFDVLREELALDSEDPRAPRWHKDTLAPERPFTVGIVGAGMSGIAMGHRLDQAGVPYVIFEKNEDVGGTWFENIYPGCRVDVPNHLYSYSFAQTGDWPQFFSSQDVLLDYFRTCADELGVRPHVRFRTEVLRAVFDDDARLWRVTVRTPEGAEETHEFQALVFAMGQLNRPKFPDLPGLDRFEGPAFHSARWDPSVTLAGKRVGVIGTGASAVQFIPEIADETAELVVFQRTPPWLVPTPNYHDDIPGGVRWLLRHVPGYARWDRLWQFWVMHEGLLPQAEVDPEWDGGGRSISPGNDAVRQLLTGYLQLTVPDPEVFEKVVPGYPPIAKRIVRDNGIWGATLCRDDVRLVTDKIEEITEKGVLTADGEEHIVDVLIYGTGFQASRFLTPVEVKGRGGADLHTEWDPDARAYLGITVPGYPNMFLMYGPNTNIVINGSIIYFSEAEAHYVLEAVRLLLETGHDTLECRREVCDAYNARVDEANRRMAWGASDVNAWYKSASGRVSQNWPFSLLEFWQRTRTVSPDDYVLG